MVSPVMKYEHPKEGDVRYSQDVETGAFDEQVFDGLVWKVVTRNGVPVKPGQDLSKPERDPEPYPLPEWY